MELIDYDNLDSYEEDLDLLELITSDSSGANKYLLFTGSNGESYAINVSKVIEILVYKDLQVVKNGTQNGTLIRGSAQIREELASIVNFDEWFGNEVLDDSEYEYIILAGFGGYNLGIMIHSVDYIVTIDSVDMKDNSINNLKTNFLTQVKLNGQEKLATIFDCDKLLFDVFEDTHKNNDIEKIETDETIDSDKVILFADDSRFVRKKVESLFEKLEVKYKIFENGQALLDSIVEYKPSQVGLVITDLEMPLLDGVGLIKSINELDGYEAINIVVHTNMSKFVEKSTLIQLGVDDVITKINLEILSKTISNYLKNEN